MFSLLRARDGAFNLKPGTTVGEATRLLSTTGGETTRFVKGDPRSNPRSVGGVFRRDGSPRDFDPSTDWVLATACGFVET